MRVLMRPVLMSVNHPSMSSHPLNPSAPISSPTNSYGETLAGSILWRPLPSNSLLIFGSSI
jgi:hypothetical protein